MATVLIKNTTASDIHLALNKKGEEHRVTVPRSRTEKQGEQDRTIHGSAPIDSEVLAELKKKPVVKHYFDSSMLIEDKAPATTKK